jgi:hypothetical protein
MLYLDSSTLECKNQGLLETTIAINIITYSYFTLSMFKYY